MGGSTPPSAITSSLLVLLPRGVVDCGCHVGLLSREGEVAGVRAGVDGEYHPDPSS